MIRFRFRSKKPITNDIQIISNTNEESKLLIRWLWVTPAADILSSLKKMLKSTKNRPKFLPQWKETRFEYQSTKSPLNFSSTNSLKGSQLFMMSRKVETVVENHLKIQSHDKYTPEVMKNKTIWTIKLTGTQALLKHWFFSLLASALYLSAFQFSSSFDHLVAQ